MPHFTRSEIVKEASELDPGMDIVSTLVAGGVKPGGIIELWHIDPRLDGGAIAQTVASRLETHGLSTHTASEPVGYRIDSEAQIKPFTAEMRHHGLETEIYRTEEGIVGVVTNAPNTVFVANERSQISPEEAKEAYLFAADVETLGRFAGYPDCCIGNFQATDNRYGIGAFNHDLRERVLNKGVDSVEHLVGIVGIQHHPCELDCEETKGLNHYSPLDLQRKFVIKTS